MSPLATGLACAVVAFAAVVAAFAARRRSTRSARPLRADPPAPGRRAWHSPFGRAGIADRRVVAQLDDLAAALRAGSSLREGIEQATQPGPDHGPPTVLDELGADLGRGASLSHACRQRAATSADTRDRLVAGALALAAAGGGNQARALDATADAVREHLALAAEVRAQSAQATLSAVVLAVTPLLFTAWSAGTDARVRAFLFGDPLGAACLALGLGLDGVGAWWMARLCRSVAR